VTEATGSAHRVRLLFGTFSKGLSMLGGFASADPDLLAYARLYAHPYGFSAALPPAYVAGMIEAVRIAVRESDRRVRLAANASYFRQALQGLGLDTGLSTTHVVPIILRDRNLLYQSGLQLRERGLYLVPIDYPAVPEDAVRFRTSLSAAHTREDLDVALNLIDEFVAKPMRAAR